MGDKPTWHRREAESPVPLPTCAKKESTTSKENRAQLYTLLTPNDGTAQHSLCPSKRGHGFKDFNLASVDSDTRIMKGKLQF